MTLRAWRPRAPKLFTGGLRLNPIAGSRREQQPLLFFSILAVSLLVSISPAHAQADQSSTPVQPSGITDSTDSGDDDDLITNHTSITVMGVAASNATIALTAAATRNGVRYTTTASAGGGGAYAVTLDLAAATTEMEVGKDVPPWVLIALPDRIARGGKTTTLSLLLSSREITLPAGFSTVLGPLIMDVALSATTPEPVTVCLPTDPEAGPRTAVLLQYDESTDAWEDTSETPGIGPLVNGAQGLCATTKRSSTLAVAYRKNRDATLSALSLDALSLRAVLRARSDRIPGPGSLRGGDRDDNGGRSRRGSVCSALGGGLERAHH